MAAKPRPKRVHGEVIETGGVLCVKWEGGLLGDDDIPDRIIKENKPQVGQKVRVNFLDDDTPNWRTLTLSRK